MNFLNYMSYIQNPSFNINTTSEHGETVLHHVISQNNLNLVKHILSKNPDVSINATYLGTPLIHAISLDKYDIVKQIIQYDSKLIYTQVSIFPMEHTYNAIEWATFKKRMKILNLLKNYERFKINGIAYQSFKKHICDRYLIPIELFQDIQKYII